MLGLYERAGRGRKPKLTKEQEKQVKEWVKEDPKNLKNVQNELPRCKQTGYGRCFARKPTVSIATLNFSLQAAGN